MRMAPSAISEIAADASTPGKPPIRRDGPATGESRHATLPGTEGSRPLSQRRCDRKTDRDAAVSEATIQAQVTAITKWGLAPAQNLGTVSHPVLVANGDNDIMVPTVNSLDLARRLPNNQLSIFPNSGHGGIFQYHDAFVAQTLSFLQD